MPLMYYSLMTPIDFPDTPSLNDIFVTGAIIWKFDGTKWASQRYGTPTQGLIDVGGPADGISRILNAGSASSLYSYPAIDCGGVS